MADLAIMAMGWISAEGYGSHRAPMVRWGEEDGVSTFKWASLFTSDCPRFGRMDPLCKIGLAAVELMAGALEGTDPAEREATGVCLGTARGCLSVDVQFWEQPSPGLFTYTLPSTLVGEISIRYGLKGPNLCLMLGREASARVVEETAEWVKTGEASGGVCVFADAVSGRAASLGNEGPPFACALYVQNYEDALRLGRPIVRRWETPESGGIEKLCMSCFQ